MDKIITIGDRKIGEEYPPFIVAEMSGNHNKSLERALEIVEKAYEAGADALKLQTYTPDTITIDYHKDEFFISDPNSLWKGRSLYDLYKDAYTPWEWHKPIFDRCKELGLICFSSPFDETAVDFLESLNVSAYKIASFEIVHTPLLRKVASTGKPVIISTGISTVSEIFEAIKTIKENGGGDVILLKCTSSYPASPASSNIRTIPHMKDLFGTPVGLSDHTLGVGVAVASVSMGAVLIEKHFTLHRSEGGVDAAFSLEPHELKLLVEESKTAWESLGRISYGVTQEEGKSKVFRRSIYVVKDIKAGDLFTSENIRVIRPGKGLEPKYFDIVLGKRCNVDLKRGTPLKWDYIG